MRSIHERGPHPARAATAEPVPQEALARLARLAARTLGASVAWITAAGGDGAVVGSRHGGDAWPGEALDTPAGEALRRRVMTSGSGVLVNDARERGGPDAAGLGILAYAGVPLLGGDGRAVGALCVLDRTPRRWTDADLSALGDIAAVAMEERALRAAVADARRDAATDALTGLWKRRQFVEMLAAEVERGAREGHHPGVVLIHLDDLARVNAAEGEAAGDALLVASAAAVSRALRPYDVAARWTGANIAVMTPNVRDDDTLRAIAQKLCAALDSDPRRLAAGGLAVSAGAARAGDGRTRPTTLMNAAERALSDNRHHAGGGVALHPGSVGAAADAPPVAEAPGLARTPMEAALELVAAQAGPLAGGDAAFVLRYIAGERVEMLAEWRRDDSPARGHLAVMPLADATAAALVRASRRPRRVRATAGARFGCVERVAAPIDRAGELWGALVVVTLEEEPLPATAERQLAALADELGMALSSTVSGDRIVTEAAATILAEDFDAEATLSAIAEAARRALGADRATCYEHSDDQRRIVSVHTTETDPARRAVLERATSLERPELPFWHMLLEHDEPALAIEDVAATDTDPRLRGRLGLGALIGVRLEHSSIRAGARPALLGSLFLAYAAPRRFSAGELATARSLAGLAGLAVANARLHAITAASLARAEERAAVDPLTNLANHRTFQERMRSEIERVRREGRNLALVVFDLDHFKQINDRHGHQAGDRVLVSFARRLAAEARPSDIVARVGGEEFAWVLPGADAVQGWEAAERLRRSMQARPLDGPKRVTVSGGVCDLSDARDAEELYRLADGALYWAKAHGRDACLRYSADVVRVLSAQEQADRLERSQTLASVRALARVVDAKDPSTLRHSGRVADLAVALAAALGWPVPRTVALREAGLVHDVGKLGVPDNVLFKPGPLDPHEYAQVQLHAPLGATIVTEVLGHEAVTWVRGHHERWDGTGYPDGLAGEDIPEGARILALADSWDVMMNVRHYKRPMRVADALAECRLQAGTQFWPAAVEALERLITAGALELEDRAAGG